MTLNLLTTLDNAVNASYTLSPRDKALLKAMMNNSPESFHQIDTTVSDIIQDGKIDLHDIPKIVLLVSQIFQMNFNIKNVDLTSIVKFVIHVILEMLPIPSMQVHIAEQLVDTSIDLLATNLTTIEHAVESCCVKKK